VINSFAPWSESRNQVDLAGITEKKKKKILLKPNVDTQGITHSSETEGELSWVKQNKLLLYQTILQVLTGQTYNYAQCLSPWDFPTVIIQKLH